MTEKEESLIPTTVQNYPSFAFAPGFTLFEGDPPTHFFNWEYKDFCRKKGESIPDCLATIPACEVTITKCFTTLQECCASIRGRRPNKRL